MRREYVEEHLGDRFEIERELGRGAMAVVYLARDRKLAKTVALKVLRHEFAATVGGERFTQEVDILARLEHPNILPLLDAGTSGPVRFYVTPLAEGDLQTRIDKEEQLPLDDALQARHDKKIDGRADIYSLASVLYEMLVGQPPFTGPTVQAVIARITKEGPPKIRVVRPDVLEDVVRAIDVALSKRPKDRPKNGAEFTQLLGVHDA